MHFDEKSAVHVSLRKIASKLNELGIAYAVVGGMALFSHGVRRFTEDIDVLVTPEGLAECIADWRASATSNHSRAANNCATPKPAFASSSL